MDNSKDNSKQINIKLKEREIEALINGEEIRITLPDGNMASIQQSFLRDVTSSLIERENKIISESELRNTRNSLNFSAMNTVSRATIR